MVCLCLKVREREREREGGKRTVGVCNALPPLSSTAVAEVWTHNSLSLPHRQWLAEGRRGERREKRKGKRGRENRREKREVKQLISLSLLPPSL